MFSKNNNISERLIKLAKERGDDFPLVVENEFFLWDAALDEALYELGYEIDEFDATDNCPSSSELEYLMVLSKSFDVPSTFACITRINEDQYVSF